MFRNPLTDAIVVLVLVLLFFGPKRLPALGQSLREFSHSITGGSHDDDEAERADEAERPALTAAAAPAADQARPAEQEASEHRS
jgi:Sec-independent protein translocase protein TatA